MVADRPTPDDVPEMTTAPSRKDITNYRFKCRQTLGVDDEGRGGELEEEVEGRSQDEDSKQQPHNSTEMAGIFMRRATFIV
jgi:hypothetical protein